MSLLKGVFLINIYSKELLARAIAKFLLLDFWYTIKNIGNGVFSSCSSLEVLLYRIRALKGPSKFELELLGSIGLLDSPLYLVIY